MPDDLRYIGLDAAGRKVMRGFARERDPAGAGGRPLATDENDLLDPSFLPPGLGAAEMVAPASETLAAGDLVNLWTDAGARKARKADASALDKPAHGFVAEGAAAAGMAHVILSGECPQAVAGGGEQGLFLSGAVPGKASAVFDPSWALWQRVGFRGPGDASFAFSPGEAVVFGAAD